MTIFDMLTQEINTNKEEMEEKETGLLTKIDELQQQILVLQDVNCEIRTEQDRLQSNLDKLHKKSDLRSDLLDTLSSDLMK